MKQLNYMISDERSAPGKYRRLIKNLKYKSDRKIIRGIIHQEQRHLKLLKHIKRRA